MLNSEFVSREKQDKLQQYIDLLIKWNKKINLVSALSLQNVEQRHVLDSIQLLTHLTQN